jgi:hypothetical protein
MLYADLPDSPSLVSLLAAVGVISAATGLLARASMSVPDARRVMGCPIVGELTGIIAILLTSMGPFDSSFEQMMGGLRPAGSFMAGPAALAGFCLGLASIELGRGIRSALRRSRGE